MKPEQAKEILQNAPEGATHVVICEVDGLLYLKGSQYIVWNAFVNSEWIVHDVDFKDMGLIHALSDLRTIVEQAEQMKKVRVDTINEVLSKKLAIIENGNECWIRVQDVLELLGE